MDVFKGLAVVAILVLARVASAQFVQPVGKTRVVSPAVICESSPERLNGVLASLEEQTFRVLNLTVNTPFDSQGKTYNSAQPTYCVVVEPR
ncbi:hypothetical protein K2X33_01200 [bacterium]|nr:hypothetical protein [bacterium]